MEFCYDETWGTVCDGLWSTNDANVACRQLGHAPSGATPMYNAFYGAGVGPIWLDGLLCLGTEDRLVDCSHDGIGNDFFCFFQHDADAGVVCLPGEGRGGEGREGEGCVCMGCSMHGLWRLDS